MDNAKYVDGHPRIEKEDVREVYKNHEVATHCFTHPTIERCPLTEVAYEIIEDRKGLEELTGKLVRGHAYPNGSYSEEIKTLFKQLGIAYARTVNSTQGYALPTDPLEWNPTTHHRNPELMNMAEYFVNFKKAQYLKLMYVWGHSYEFEIDNNWHVIENFAKKVGNKDDIWYATNIEIVDYMDAAERVQVSVNGDFAYNPNATSVWLEVDKKHIELKPGITTTL
jgi:hypothetical protein